MSKIYYWANNVNKNSGEGILALNFLKLLKLKFKKYQFENINKFKMRDNFLYNYFLPFLGVGKLWIYHIKGKKICYVNYLPIWNIFLFLTLPKNTILGPITGTNTKKNILYAFLKKIGIKILKFKKKKLLFSHSQFREYFKKDKDKFFNFLLFNFSFDKTISKKKYDFIFYYKKNSNKGNNFLTKIILELSKRYKIAIIGDKCSDLRNNQNINNFISINRNKALNIIKHSKYAIISKENYLSYFALDCLSKKLRIFFNKELKLDKSINTNMFIPINFNNFEYSIKIIKKELTNEPKRKKFKFKIVDFSNYL